MTTKKIYIEVIDDNLYYRDSENHSGKTITTNVQKGSKVEWGFHKYSGIGEIKNIIPSNPDFFTKQPVPKRNSKQWKALVSEKAAGETTYTIEYTGSNTPQEVTLKSAGTQSNTKDEEPPSIKVLG